MQRDNKQLQDKLNDLVLLGDVIKIDKNFIIGYLFRNIDNSAQSRIKQCVKVAELIDDANSCQFISKVNFYELIIVISHICSQKYDKRRINLLDFFQETIELILYDHNYLKNKYFTQNLNLPNQQLKEQKPNKIQEESLDIKRSKSNIAECPVCLIEIQHHNVCVLTCGHIIHQECFQSCMKELILNKKFPLKCPFQECKKHIETEDIQEYLPKELIEKYYEFTLHNFVEKNTKNMSWCLTPGCSNAFQFDGNIKTFNCLKCNKGYCLTCKTQSHEGKTCEQNKQQNNISEEDKQFIEFAKGAKYKQCPECRFWVQKSKGCCHMTCRCQFQFCYYCGGKYGDCHCDQTYDRYYGSEDDDDDDDDDEGYEGSDGMYDESNDDEMQQDEMQKQSEEK